MRRSFLTVPIAIGLGLALPIAVHTASAHWNIIDGSSVCEENGTFTVTWTVANNVDGEEAVTLSATGGGTLTPTSATIAASPSTPYSSITAVQSGIPGSATGATLHVDGQWTDGATWSGEQRVSLSGECTASTTTTAATTTTSTTTTTTTTTTSSTTTTASSTTVPVSVQEETTTTAATTTVAKSLTFDVLGPVCVANHPYIRWQLSSTGLTPAQNRATLTITDVNGNHVATLTDQPFDGQTLWPGAGVDPMDWPGWVLIGGVWFTDPADAVLRQGVYVRADVNPTAGPLFVAYPAATSACSGPEQQLQAPPDPTLPTTGSSSSTETMWMAAVLVGFGAAAVLVARRRRTT